MRRYVKAFEEYDPADSGYPKKISDHYMTFLLDKAGKTFMMHGSCEIDSEFETSPSEADWKHAFQTQEFPDPEILIKSLEEVGNSELADKVEKGDYTMENVELSAEICKLRIKFDVK
jgi:hypothetical protein